MEIRIYFEGDKRLRPGFHALLGAVVSRARECRCRLEIVATGGNPEDDFRVAIKTHRDAVNVLLKDSEGPLPDGAAEALCRKYGLTGHEGSIFWMVEMTEAWLHADVDALQNYYGWGFVGSALKSNPNVEEIPKRDLARGLQAATKKSRKGAYRKPSHTAALLEAIDPMLVRKRAPHCEEFFAFLFGTLSR